MIQTEKNIEAAVFHQESRRSGISVFLTCKSLGIMNTLEVNTCLYFQLIRVTSKCFIVTCVKTILYQKWYVHDILNKQ